MVQIAQYNAYTVYFYLMNKCVYTYLHCIPYWLFMTFLNIFMRSKDSNSHIANKLLHRKNTIVFI